MLPLWVPNQEITCISTLGVFNVTRDKFHWLFKLKSRSTHKGGNNGHESFSEGKWIREENEIKFPAQQVFWMVLCTICSPKHLLWKQMQCCNFSGDLFKDALIRDIENKTSTWRDSNWLHLDHRACCSLLCYNLWQYSSNSTFPVSDGDWAL